MTVLKPYQVAAAALLGGFPANEVPRAVAVAKGESSYNTSARNFCCSGLWQIHRTAHADKIRAAGGEAKLTDPVVNASLAKQIWSAAGGWCTSGRVGQCNPWQAYGVSNGTGSWSAKLAEGAKAYAEVQRRQAAGESLQSMAGSSSIVNAGNPLVPDAIEGAIDSGQAIAGAAKAMVEFANRTGKWIADPDNWIRVGYVIGGGVLIAVGLRVAFNTQINAMGKQVVSWVVPGGKATKLARTGRTTGRVR
jgi:lysozyme-like protein